MTPLRARLMLVAAVLLGIAGDQLFRTWPWGLGLVGWVALAVLAAMATGWGHPFAFDGTRESRDRLFALAAVFIASIGIVLRDAPTLVFYNVVALLVAAALALWPTLGRSLGRFRIRDLFRSWTNALVTVMFGTPALTLGDAEWSTAGLTDRRVRAALIGCVLAVPPVVVVGALLGEADPVFGDFLGAWKELGIQDLVQHSLVVGVIAWPVGGWLRGMVRRPMAAPVITYNPPARIDFFGIAPALYAITGLLAAFLGLQTRALFGGQGYVESTVGLTYAEYARRGFFELVAVTAVVLGALLLADWALDRDRPDATRRFRAVGWMLLALVGILMASALQRMWVYVSFYGLSDTRLYASAGMAWLAAACAWFGWTILRGARARFGVGILVICAGWIGGLDLINPEALVVRVNLARALAGKEFDVEYHSRLSADAVPALLRASGELPAETCIALVTQLHMRDALARPEEDADWRSWTLPRARSFAALGDPLPAVGGRACHLPWS